MSDSIRKLNENPVTELADTDYIVACDASGALRSVSLADLFRSISVGGRNLLKNSGDSYQTSSFNCGNFYFGDDKPKQGESVVVTIWGDFSDVLNIALWNSGGSLFLTYFIKVNNNVLRARLTWNIANTENTHIALYQNDSDGSPSQSNVRIDRIKLERGVVATDWSPAPEDILDRLTALENRGGNRLIPNYLQSARERRAA